MPKVKVNFGLKYDDWIKYQEKFVKFPEKVKEATNEYMHNEARQRMINSITKEMPISTNENGQIRDKSNYPNKAHAKKSIWYVSFNFEQAVTIENKLAGGKRNSFYYLYFPHEGTNSSSPLRHQDKNPFMERAVDKQYNYIVTGLFNVIDREIKEEF